MKLLRKHFSISQDCRKMDIGRVWNVDRGERKLNAFVIVSKSFFNNFRFRKDSRRN